MREREGFLARVEESLSRVSGWLSARRGGGEVAGTGDRPRRIEAFRGEVARARRALAETARADLARARASLEDLRHDYEVPPQHTTLTRAELEAFRRHLRTTARLLGDLSNVDSPSWDRAHEEYERSWEEVERAFASSGEPASP